MIGPRVRERRLELKMRQNEFIQKIAVATGGHWAPSRVDVTRVERGLRSVNDAEVVAVCAVLRCDPTWLLFGGSTPQELEAVREAVLQWQQQQEQLPNATLDSTFHRTEDMAL